MLREIELAALTVGDVTVLEGPGCGVAVISVRASKTDTDGQGAARQLKCTCPAVECPVAAARRLIFRKQPFHYLVRTRNGASVDKGRWYVP